MSETVSVSVSGLAFSLLCFENIKSEYNQEGFLLGDIITRETNKVTDADHRVVNRERIIKIKSIIPCPQQFYFYNASGEMDEEKIRNFIGDQGSKVIGWYMFKRKRFSAAKLTFREKIIHKQLAELFNPAYFTCCLLTLESSNIRATYSLCQTFVRYCMSRYESLPLHVVNLSDPNFTYKSAEPMSDIVSNVIKTIRNSGDCSGHVIVQKVQDSLQQHMKELVEKSTEQEQQLFELEQRVKQLKHNKKLSREYGVQDNEANAITENGTSENSQNSEQNFIENSQQPCVVETSPEAPKKRRGRPRKGMNTIQNNIDEKSCDMFDDEKDETVVKSNTSKSKISYSEMAQKSKN